MKSVKLVILVLAGTIANFCANSQNVLLNILTQNSGIVNIGGTIFLEVTVCNTDPVDSVPIYKLRPQISVPAGIAYMPVTGHKLPANWSITSNDGSTIRLSNGRDMIPANACRTILIAVKGNALGGPSTISGNMLFSNGQAPGSAPGGATLGDNPADNSSTSTCRTIR